MKQIELFNKHVRNTAANAVVQEETVLVCHLTNAVMEAMGCQAQKVYISSRILKHMYDKKPAEEFDAILRHLQDFAKLPEHIYLNKEEKRGGFGFVKEVAGEMYFCSIQVEQQDEATQKAVIVTAFRLRQGKREKYLASYELLWSWKAGEPSS